ncbi:retinoic acid receptor responder protein 2 [Microcaecilia unicolor]|uniref:Retinoic acid receptor responder protein 2 n=1 Tax=Microcaecilia unicolor TaxID=1415580 RepID=A0A6P7X8P2_9AMPH|nr:retinoic acid receptor responder protein 2-like [Microcaecilia unicolor]
MKKLLLALWLSTVALPGQSSRIQANELSTRERNALDAAVETFNTGMRLYAYKILSIRLKNATAVYEGEDVRITFSMKQTNCRKHNINTEQCHHKRKGLVLHCLACFAFEEQILEPLAYFMDCVPSRQPAKERLIQRQKKCEEVKEKIPVHYISQYSFLKRSDY